MSKTIDSRDDISILVSAFYAKIRKDDMLGPIFNSHIAKTNWPVHLEKLTDFWETNLLGVIKFKGNPTQKHIKVDQNLKHSIKQEHFGQWLLLWSETIDQLFIGPIANKAKEAASRMAQGQFMVMLNSRPSNKT